MNSKTLLLFIFILTSPTKPTSFAATMEKFDIKDASSIYPNNPFLRKLAESVIRGDSRAVADGIRTLPSAVTETGTGNISLLMLAVAHSKTDIVRDLMRAGADPFLIASKQSNLGSPAGLALRMTSKPDIFQVLIEEGLDLNGGKEGESSALLHSAILQTGDNRLRQIIESKKVNLNLANRVQDTPLLRAIRSIQYDKALLLLDSGADPTLGRTNPLKELKEHTFLAADTKKDIAKKLLEKRLQAVMSESTEMKPAPVRPTSNSQN
jgi:hypothetical protein